MQRSPDEITEIERHKYFLSEKKGHDVGWDFAESDWDRKFGDAWRAAHSPNDRSMPAGTAVAAVGASRSVRIDSADRPGQAETMLKRIGRILGRVFSS